MHGLQCNQRIAEKGKVVLKERTGLGYAKTPSSELHKLGGLSPSMDRRFPSRVIEWSVRACHVFWCFVF